MEWMVQTLWLSTNSPEKIHRSIGEAVRASVEHAIGLQETTVINVISVGVSATTTSTQAS